MCKDKKINREKQAYLQKNADMNHYELDGLELFVYLCSQNVNDSNKNKRF